MESHHNSQELNQITIGTTLEKSVPDPNLYENDSNETIKNHNHLNYRPDIDGLRSIAVSIVVIFHAWPHFMPGGFIGVDIFFVISGFLISSIIIKQKLKNKFSYTDFYSRRIKRIYPALIAVMLFVLIFSAKKMLRRPLQIVTQTMTFSTFFAANINILTAEHDYFDPETTTNPLLHLWSLGVEEQFYIFWPLLIIIIITWFQKKTLHILSAFIASSFIFSIIAVYKNTQFAFYFPFCRFWQMSVGGLVAYLNFKIQNKIVINALSIVSLIGIFSAVWIMDENSIFPGFWALVPTLGAACIIQAGNESFFNKKVLSSKGFVFVGKISYSLYLWHWPLLVFSRLLYPQGSKSIYAKPELMILIAVVLSVISYFFIENPFRFRKEKIVSIILFLIMIGIGIGALWVKSHAKEFQARRLIELDEEKRMKILNDWTPIEEDYIIVKGRKIPNSSKNPHIDDPTVDKIKFSLIQRGYGVPQRFKLAHLQKKIKEGSKYFRFQGDLILHHYEVANEGRKNQLFIIGDSHARFILHRFQKLYEDAVEQGRKEDFPTIVGLVRQISTFVPFDLTYNFTMGMINDFLPDRVFFVYRWNYVWSFINQTKSVPIEQTKYFEDMMSQFEIELGKIAKKGIKIFLGSVHPEGKPYEPGCMSDENGVIESNVQPMKYSEFHKIYIKHFEILKNVAKNVGAQIVDFSDHMCYNDVCEVLIPNGYPIDFDDNHQTKFYSRYWAGSVDFLTEF